MDLGLTSGVFATIVVMLALITPVVAVAVSRRVRGRAGIVRDAQRWLLVIAAQVAAILAVLVLINNSFGLYSSWDDLLGRTSSATASDVIVPAPTTPRGTTATPGTVAVLPWKNGLPQGFTAYDSPRTFQAAVQVPGSSAPLKVYVAVPPEYDQPAYAHVRFPVVELFHGYPGSPTTWFHAMDVRAKLADAVQAGATPFVLVIPQISVAGAPDLECTDLPGQPQIATFLTTEVRSVVTTHFRVQSGPTGWAAMGYSEGGYCAAQLTLRHPDLFAAGVDISGYDAPESSYFDALPAQKKAGSLSTLLRKAPAVALLASASSQDPQSSGSLASLKSGARPPTVVTTTLYAQGGHNTADWSAALPGDFAWLSQHLSTARP
jgi:enterochelin esterase-like enzyme